MVREAVRCAKVNYGSKIYADVLDDRLLYFYKRLGFKENKEGSLLLHLSPKQKDKDEIRDI